MFRKFKYLNILDFGILLELLHNILTIVFRNTEVFIVLEVLEKNNN